MAKIPYLSLLAALAAAACGTGQIVGGSAPPAASDGSGAADDPEPGADAGDPPPSPDAASAFSCTGAGIGAFADRLVVAARASCTSDGIGVVTDTNYDCLRAPIFDLAPPFPAEAFGRVRDWAYYGNNFSGKTTLFQCVDFAFTVTAAVCGQPINGGDALIDENMVIPGYTYLAAAPGAAQSGDILVMDGHISIAAEVIDSDHARMAEANCLNPDGSMPSNPIDTGVISNTRVDTLDDPWILGWYRRR